MFLPLLENFALPWKKVCGRPYGKETFNISVLENLSLDKKKSQVCTQERNLGALIERLACLRPVALINGV